MSIPTPTPTPTPGTDTTADCGDGLVTLVGVGAQASFGTSERKKAGVYLSILYRP